MSVVVVPVLAPDPACCPPLSDQPLRPDTAGRLAAQFKALGDPVRLRLLSLIASAPEVCVCDLTDAFDVTGATISHHLRVLREAGLVDSDRRGTWVYYRVQEAALDLLGGLLRTRAPEPATPQPLAPASRTPESRTLESRALESRTLESRTPQSPMPQSRMPQSRTPQSRTPQSPMPLFPTPPSPAAGPSAFHSFELMSQVDQDELTSGGTDVVRLLADPLRARIVRILAVGPACTSHLVADTGAKQPNVSGHLKQLREAGVVVTEPHGRFTYYRLVPEVLESAARHLGDLAATARAHHDAFRPC